MPITISLQYLNEHDVLQLVDNLQTIDGKLQPGYIDIAGKKYKLSFDYTDRKINITAEREYTGKFAFVKNLILIKGQLWALKLSQKAHTFLNF